MKILTACINALLIFLFKRWTFKQDTLPCKYPGLALATIHLTGVLFVVFTFAPPQIPLFQDPITGTFGISGYKLQLKIRVRFP
jgi:hypothetical protein